MIYASIKLKAYIHEANTRFGRKVVKVELDKKKIEAIFLQQTKLKVYDNVQTNVMAPEPDLSNCNPSQDLVLQKVYGKDAVFQRQTEITLWLAIDNVAYSDSLVDVSQARLLYAFVPQVAFYPIDSTASQLAASLPGSYYSTGGYHGHKLTPENKNTFVNLVNHHQLSKRKKWGIIPVYWYANSHNEAPAKLNSEINKMMTIMDAISVIFTLGVIASLITVILVPPVGMGLSLLALSLMFGGMAASFSLSYRLNNIMSAQDPNFLHTDPLLCKTAYDSQLGEVAVSSLDPQYTSIFTSSPDVKREPAHSLGNDFIVNTYSINLMWINNSLDPEQTYLNKSKTPEELFKRLLLPAIKWKQVNPDAEVILWYDSVYTTKKSFDRTSQVLSEYYSKYGDFKIVLKDIREIPIVKSNPNIFSNQLPLYFRIDLLKGIIVVDSIERGKVDSAIFTDLEVGDLRKDGMRMNKDELFNPTIMERLREIGLILGDSRYALFENQFFQLVNHPRMINIIKHSFINLCLMRAVTALNASDEISTLSISLAGFNENYKKVSAREQMLPELCLLGFKEMIKIFNQEFRCSKLFVRVDDKNHIDPNGKWVPYDIQKHGYEPFGLYTVHGGSRFGICLGDRILFTDNPRQVVQRTFFDIKNRILRELKDQVRPGNHHTTRIDELTPKPVGTPEYCCVLMTLASSDPYSYYGPTTVSSNCEEVINRSEREIDSDFQEQHQTADDLSLPWQVGQSVHCFFDQKKSLERTEIASLNEVQLIDKHCF